MKQAKKYKRGYEWCIVGGGHRVKAGTVFTAHQGTMYRDEASNYFTGCPKCHAHNNESWAEMWREYWSSRGC